MTCFEADREQPRAGEQHECQRDLGHHEAVPQALDARGGVEARDSACSAVDDWILR